MPGFLGAWRYPPVPQAAAGTTDVRRQRGQLGWDMRARPWSLALCLLGTPGLCPLPTRPALLRPTRGHSLQTWGSAVGFLLATLCPVWLNV